jgi:hypothetical protein
MSRVPKTFAEKLSAFPGYVAPLTLYPIAEVEKIDLMPSSPAGWNKSWLVVGRESLCGDPIVIELDSKSKGVAIASACTGEWIAAPLAESVYQFFAMRETLRRFQGGSVSRSSAIAAFRSINLSEAADTWVEFLDY